jgi:hypothetical protein
MLQKIKQSSKAYRLQEKFMDSLMKRREALLLSTTDNHESETYIAYSIGFLPLHAVLLIEVLM